MSSVSNNWKTEYLVIFGCLRCLRFGNTPSGTEYRGYRDLDMEVQGVEKKTQKDSVRDPEKN